MAGNLIRRQNREFNSNQLRHGAATVEFAMVLPLLLFVFVVGVDFARAYHFSQLVTEAAQKGAECASNSDLADQLPYDSVHDAAVADLTYVHPTPTVETSYQLDEQLPSATVTVSYEFQPICRHFGLTVPFLIRRSACLRLHPSIDLPEGGDP